MHLPTPLDILRAAVAGEQIVRLRRGCFGLAVVFFVTQVLSTFATPHSGGERMALLLGITTLMGASVTGYRRGSFGLVLRGLILASIVMLAPLLGAAVVGAAYTSTWLLALYPGVRSWLTAIGACVAIVIGEVVAVRPGVPLDPGNLVGETVSLCMMALFLGQLRISLAERDILQSTLTRQAHYDSLTDLPNRRWFHQRLDAAVERYRRIGEPYALLMLDLDDFKRINDSYGHEHGDRILLAVAQRTAASVRETDCCARLGGDEFAVLLENCRTPERPDALAQQLAEEIGRPVDLDGVPERVGVSIGVTWSGENATIALRDADRAMYAAKARTRVAHALSR